MSLNRNVLWAALIAVSIAAITVGNEIRSESSLHDSLQILSARIENDQWSQAAAEIEALERDWRKRRLWIALNNSTQNVQSFERTLTVLDSFVRYGDKTNAAAQLPNWPC
jgi:hypothetical protein